MDSRQQVKVGLACAISAFGIWGLVPIFFKQLVSISPWEVVSHRIVWSAVILLLALAIQRRLGFIRQLRLATFGWLCVSAVLMTSNWFIFIWAVGENKILSTSLGYFINPLASVVLGMIFLKERLRVWQWVSVALAAGGVLNQLVWVGSLPMIALTLALSFAFYGLIRKRLTIHPVEGLFIEACVMLPVGLAYFYWLDAHDLMQFMHGSLVLDLLLVAAGFVTVIPLLFFAAGTQRLNLNVVGMVQYITPTMSFMIAILLYDEPFEIAQLITFCFIWLGLLVFSIEGYAVGKIKKRISNL